MLQALKTFLSDLAGTEEPHPGLASDDYRVAAAALLVRAGQIDGTPADAERAMLADLLARRFELSSVEVQALIEQAEEEDREAVDLYRFTSVLKRRLDDAGRKRIIEMMWDVAYADGAVHKFEENLIWRVSELIGVSARDRIALRQRVAAERVHPPRESGNQS